MNRANHVWFHEIRQDVLDRDAQRIVDLNPKTIVSGHGPTIRNRPTMVCSSITRIGDMEPIQFPDQEEFEQMLAAAPSAPTPMTAPPACAPDASKR
jgi:hypothetical protein